MPYPNPPDPNPQDAQSQLPNRLKEWRLLRGLSMQALAEKCGTTRAQIDKLERGERRLTIDWLMRLAKPLNCNAADLLPTAEPEEKNLREGLDANIGAISIIPSRHYAALPVRSAARGGEGQEMFLSDGPLDHIPCPDQLRGNKNAYAIYVVGTSMQPKFWQQQILLVNPDITAKAGDGVVITRHDGSVQIKEWVSGNQEQVMLREYAPVERVFAVPRHAIQDLHTVIGIFKDRAAE